jgi:5-methylcytosine-specific restriction endonuclease McrA
MFVEETSGCRRRSWSESCARRPRTWTARRLACDASVIELREREDGSVLSLGRKRRTVSPALRRALDARDRGCRFPGCVRTRFVDAHHVRHGSRGGETNLENLVLLCRRHHRLVHERGYARRHVPQRDGRSDRPRARDRRLTDQTS